MKVLRTYVTLGESLDQYGRDGFVHCCQYGAGMEIEPNEIGCIAKPVGKYVPTNSGLYTRRIKVTERILLVESA
jgi:hypothetical protein